MNKNNLNITFFCGGSGCSGFIKFLNNFEKPFFFSKNSKGNGISLKGLFMFFTYPTRKWKSFRGKLREKAKQREFAKTISYDDMDGIDIFVSDKKKEDIKIAEEELKDVELVLVDEKDNNNG